MANYHSTARSNYFAVKDERAFRKWAALIGLSILEPAHHNKVADGISRFAIAPDITGDSGGWPTSIVNDETDPCIDMDIDVPEQLSAHLADGEVAILMETGSESLRYLTGTAVAVNSKGETVMLDLTSIYEAANHLGTNITRAEY